MLKRSYSLLEGESCGEDLGSQKKQRIDIHPPSFLFEEKESLPITIQRILRDNYNPYLSNNNILGKLNRDGLLFFLVNRQIVIWGYSLFGESEGKSTLIREVVVPFPDEVDSLRSEWVAFAGERADQLFVVVSPQRVYYWREDIHQYISLDLSLSNASVIAVIPSQSKPGIFIVTSQVTILFVEVHTNEVEYFDDKVTWSVQTRTDYSLTSSICYRNTSLLHSVLSTFLPLSSSSISSSDIAVEYPFIFIIEDKRLIKQINIETNQVVQTIPLTPEITSATIQRCYADHSILTILTLSYHTYSLHIYQMNEDSGHYHSTVSLPIGDYSSCSVFITETYHDINIHLVIISKHILVVTIPLSTHHCDSYNLCLQNTLFAGVAGISPGVTFVTSSHLMTFVPEGDSDKNQITPDCLIYLQDFLPSEICSEKLLASIIPYYQCQYYKQAMFCCGVVLNQASHREEALRTMYQSIIQLSIPERMNMILSLLDCFSRLQIIHLLNSLQSQIEKDVNESIQRVMEGLLSKEVPLLEWIPQLTQRIQNLLSYWNQFHHHFPSSFKCSIVLWKDLPSIRNQFHDFVVKIHDIPHLNYHKKVVEECLVSSIKLFTTPAVSQDSLVDECINQLEELKSTQLITLLQEQQYYSYLVRQPSLLTMTQHNQNLATYAVQHFLHHPSNQLYSLIQQWPSLLNVVIESNPLFAFQYALFSKKAIEHVFSRGDAIQLIWNVKDREKRRELLAVLSLEFMSGEPIILPHTSSELVEKLSQLNEVECMLVKETQQTKDVDEESLWVTCLNRIDALDNNGRRIFDSMLLMIDNMNQIDMKTEDFTLSILHHALCLDESLMEKDGINMDSSALYYVLSRLKTPSLKEWKQLLLSKYHINNLYLQFWEIITTHVQ